jgi:hypothetical protein
MPDKKHFFLFKSHGSLKYWTCKYFFQFKSHGSLTIRIGSIIFGIGTFIYLMLKLIQGQIQ